MTQAPGTGSTLKWMLCEEACFLSAFPFLFPDREKEQTGLCGFRELRWERGQVSWEADFTAV